MQQNPQTLSILKKTASESSQEKKKKKVRFNPEVQFRIINKETGEYEEFTTSRLVCLRRINIALNSENFIASLKVQYQCADQAFTDNATKLKNAIDALNLKRNTSGNLDIEESLKISPLDDVKAFLYPVTEFCASLIGIKDLPPSNRELKTNASKEIKSFEEYLKKEKKSSVQIVQ